MDSESKIFVAGHNGLVGSAIVRNLESKGFTNIITMDRIKLDLTKLHDVQMFFMMEQPEYVFLAAAKVGGIGANADYPADFIYENLMIQTNVISSAVKSGVKKLLFLGSSCIYPKFANQPITEDQLLDSRCPPSN
jgi:GDP-L-fucose synthase